MPFTDTQVKKLRATVQARHVKDRQIEGKTLHYLEGWHVVAEANRIFGFDAWDRVTVSSRCVWERESGYRFSTAYLTRVRIRVRAGEIVIVREGLGSGESTAPSPGQAHERASKAAETDATKRALSTFGNSFGLSLYRDKREPPLSKAKIKSADPKADVVSDRHPTAPGTLNGNGTTSPCRIDKSELTFFEPKRRRDRDHLRFVAAQPCLICGKTPSHAHHLRIAQPRALGRKVSDEFTVPLCSGHHHDLHMRGDERAWWQDRKIEPMGVADELWRASAIGDVADAAE